MQKKCLKVKIKFLILVIVTNRGIKDNNNLHNKPLPKSTTRVISRNFVWNPRSRRTYPVSTFHAVTNLPI